MKLDGDELGAVFEHTTLPNVYHDPVLARSPEAYAQFLADLARAKVVNFAATVNVVGGIFF
eukprot:3450067-Lingulodinium_polyedra.AAC.1